MKNQIDYQQINVPINNSFGNTTASIPLPINSILKGVDIKKELVSNRNHAVQVSVSLRQTDANSNIRLDHELLRGNIYNCFDGTNNLYQKRLSAILDIPIQKEGIELFFNFYNVSGSSGRGVISYIVKNLEGGI